MLSWVWRGIIVLALAAILYVPVASLLTAGLIGWLVTAGNVDWNGPVQSDPFALGYRGDPRQAFGLPFETVGIPMELGDSPAWLVPAAGAAPGLLAIYVHGIGGLRENGYRQLSVLHEAGLPVLLPTYRNDAGAPQAPNRIYGFGLNEWRDLDLAVTWAGAQGYDRIVLVADSMGGGIAGQFLMHSSQAGRVVAMALDAPALDFPAVAAARVAAHGLPLAETIGEIGSWLASLALGADLTGAVSRAAVAAFPGPLFLVHGSADRLVPVSISDELVAERAGPTTYVRTGADHLLSWQENPERYREEMLDFLRETLAVP